MILKPSYSKLENKLQKSLISNSS